MLLRMDTLKTGMPRILWLCILVTFLVLVIYSESAESKKVDSDLIFDNLDKTNSISRNRPHHVVKRRNHPSSHVEDHWLYTTLSRLKRSITELMGEKKTVSSKKTKQKRKRRQHQDTILGPDTNENNNFEVDDNNEKNIPDEGEGDDNDDEYKDEDDGIDDDDEDYEDEFYESTTTGANGGITEIGIDDTTTPRKHFTTSFPTNYDDEDDIDNEDNSSGDGEIQVTAAPKDSEVKRYYRITITVREPFTEEFNDRNSYKYREFADQIKEAVENVYEGTPGINSLSVIGIYKRHKDSFTSRVVLDLGINSSPVDDEALKNTLLDHISRARRLGNYEALENDFSFVKFDAPIRTCEEYEIPCKTGACVNATSICDGFTDCSDGSDEDGCPKNSDSDTTTSTSSTTTEQTIPPTTPTTTTTSTTEAIEGSGEGSIPSNGNCRADDAVPCSDGSRTICSDQVCDGRNDCNDGGDEENCSSTDCTSGEFSCDLTRCILARKRCDGIFDCDDQTDERECTTCSGDAVLCDANKCIRANQKCDGVVDCTDGTDEENCIPVSSCIPGQFQCQDGSCINDHQRCDRRRDCPNGEDEFNCAAGCNADQFACGDGKCIPLAAKCNRKYDCRDQSDEKNCPCHPDDFHCGNGYCIPADQRCNGLHNCQDGSDEMNCDKYKPCHSTEWRCADGTCISRSSRCNFVRDCPNDNSDERDCDVCQLDQFRCGNGSCISLSHRCDGKIDCPSGEDEDSCARCTENEFDCGNGDCIPDDRVCDSRRDCPDGKDEYDCPPPRRCQPSEFTCDDGTCIPGHLQCNGRAECRDRSDEADCPCTQNQFPCLDGGCIDGSLRCNKYIDCRDGSDEINCPTESPPRPTESPTTTRPRCPSGSYQCRSGQCIPANKICDGPADCFDMSDELDCAGSSMDLHLRTYPDAQDIKENREVVFQCRDEGPMRASVQWTRPNGQPLPPGSRDNKGRLEIPNIKVEHAGEYICEAKGFQPNAPNAQVMVRLNVEKWTPSLPPRSRTACAPNQATCSNGDCIPKEAVCDGRKDCTDGSDESRCRVNGCEPNEYSCANRECILKTWRCDGIHDCADGSDEADCAPSSPSSSTSMCLSHHFTCHAQNQCIPKSYHCDLERDCNDGSDEIGCAKPVIRQPPPPMVKIAIGEIFEIKCAAVGVPVPEINWRRNWGHIPQKCRTTSVDGVGILTCPDIQPEDQGSYSCESINSKGITFAGHDTILTVTTENICRPGYFNDEARTESECIKCFCFGHGGNCRSADLFIYHYQPPFDSLNIVGVRVDPITRTVEIRDEPIYRNSPEITPVGLHGIHTSLQSSAELTQPNLVPYFSMPESYRENQLKSYGGYLRYKVNHNNRGYSVPGPDVILSGNGYVLLHQSRQQPESFRDESRAVRFFEGEWVKKTDDGSDRTATREEIMMTLANINNILIKLQYNEGPLNTTISEIVMESAATPDNNLGVASYVEECTCPVGYTGLSCERCDEGYERHSNGPWLGQCYKMSRKCPTGMYGDPDRGIECQTCPCPLTNSQNQFGTSCSLAPDGDVVCDCPLGYIGRRCEQCASGYEGNPMVPGDSCRPRSQELCSKAGSKSLSPMDGRCDCKDNVEGPTCNQCKANSFDLSEDNQYGCVSCFCMGVTSKCGSSAWYRDQISTSFASSTNDFAIVDIDDRENLISEGIRLDQGSRQILYSSFPSQNIFYWSLPPRYLGNKLMAYGGYLRYTLKYVPLPGGQSSRNSAADVQLISANHIDLLYYAKEQSFPTNSAQTFVVPLLEQYWQRTDGQQADREHLLMALSDLKSILIKATYTTNTKEAALISVSLDTANVRNTGSLERASAVEHCYCPEGYKGLSCEDCAFGYTRGSGGLYLGICEPCSCNGHSNECDPERGECINCRDHTTGRFCDKCLPGYEGDPTNGIPCRYREGSSCQCDPRGSVSNECYNGVCACKQNVVGNLCDRCRQGTFGLNSSDIDGCQSCFCSGVATECSESNLYIEQIPTQILDEESHGFSLTDQYLRNRISDNFEFNYGINEITYRLRPDDSGLYWSVPQILTGNQIKSYGGKLEFRQKYTEYSRGRPIPDKDVIIIGDKLSIYWTNPNPLIPNVQNKVSIPISISNGWQRLDQTTGARPASREDILIALSNIREILIRAKPTDTTDSSSLSDVTLETAIEAYATEGKATSVEVCRCPIGYEGTSCESCVLGYYRDINDIAAGPLGSCTKCPCSQNADGCSMGPDNTVICQCVPGYSGSRCEYYGDNNSTDNTSNNNDNGRPVTINVTITAPTIKIFEIGSTLRLNCSAVSVKGPSSINWKKDGGYLPETAINDGRGLLIITNLKVSDSGRYICEAEDGYSIATKDVTVVVGTSLNKPPRVVVNPPFVDVKEGQRIEIQCAASGSPTPRYSLQRADSQPLNRQYSFDNGVFIIDQALVSDKGKYNCIAENIYGTDTATFEVFVAVADFVRVTIEPPSVTASSGETFSLRCLSQSQSLDVQWNKQDGEMPYNSRIDRNGILTVTGASVEDSGVYICSIFSPGGAVGRGSALVEISESNGEFPSVNVSPKSVTISQGGSTSIRCDVSGSPPPSIKWTKVNQNMTQHAQQIGSTLYIRNADERDEGAYVCVAINIKGMNQAHVDVFVRRTAAPVIRIFPNSTQNVIEGHTLDLECVSDGGSPSRITWTRSSGLPLSRNIEQYDQGRIRFNAITKDAEGIYICSAENEAGVTTASAVIYVQTRPEIRIVPDEETIYRREGSSLSLECYATGSPEPSVSWTKYSSYNNLQAPRQLRPPSSNYAIEKFNRLTKEDEGLYSCQARSSIGNVQKQVRLIIDTLPERGDMTGEDAASENNNGFKDLDRPRNPNDINRYTVPVGTRAELHCSISTSNNGFDSVDTTWERADNAQLPENAFVRGGTLFVDNAQEAARGYYRCLATKRSNGQLIFTLDAYLDVIALPNITLVPARQVVRPGDNAYVQCIASGQQPITITWSPISREFPSSVSISNGLLKFNNIQPSDAGRYRCTAVNSVGEADSVADVLVQETRYTPSIHAVTRAHEASAGSSVTLQCQTVNGTNSEIRWYKENMSLPKNAYITPEKNLQIDNVQLSNEGRYFCEIRTNAGRRTDFVDLGITGPLSEANLIQPALFISPSEREYRIGEHVDVNCQSNQPGAITTWSKPAGWLDDNVQSIGGTLRISKLRRENAGVYRCEATGYQGVYHKDYNLKIIEDNSMLQAAVETKIAPKGSSIVLDCRTTLEEPTSYVWTKAVGELPGYIDPYTRTIQLNDLTSSDAGAYMCTAKNANKKVEVPIILVITGIVPYFSQAPVSFIALPTLMNSYRQFNFEISFKPEREDGLILYNGNKQNERGADFISLALVGGIPEFRYNLGYSVTIVRSRPISIGQWHTVKVIRNRKKVTMYVDDEGPYTVTADGKLIGLELSENLYIGGVPRFDNISPEVEIDTGFVGCISRFKMSHSVQDILRDAIDKEGITNCETCSENRCRNKGVCQESLSNEGYICICHSGFSGPTCSKRKQESCSPYSCGSGRCVDTDESFECMCPIGKGGSRCEREVDINEPAFQNDAYIAYDVSKQRKLRYSMKFKPNSTKDGILLYCGETEKDHGDFASLTLKDQHVEFRFDVGNGPTVVRSPRKVNAGEWVAVTASRIKSEGRLIVNGEAPTIERSLGNNKTPNLLTYIYVGGVNKQKIKVNEGVGVESGFDGCITDINIDDKKIDMIQSAVESSNIQDCSSVNNNNDISNNINSESSPTPYNHYQTGCSSNPCRNDGICDPLSPTTYQCNCVNGYSGRDCEISPNQCEFLKPCQNNGLCKGNTTYYHCDCTLGFTGTNCEQRSKLRTDAHFDGNGYLEFDKEMLPHMNDKEEVIALELSTNSSFGLIFWQGQPPNQDTQGKDYLALALVNGYLEFTYDLGSGPAIIYDNNIRINDGERHLVILKRQGKIGSLEVDRQYTQKDESVGSASTLTCNGNIYLGGAPNISFMTADRYNEGFVGCIHVFELQGYNQIDLGSKALSGLNVKPCSSYEGIYSFDSEQVV